MDDNQRYNQQSLNSSSQYYVPPKKNHNFISIILVIVILLGAIGIYFAMKERLGGSESSEQSNLLSGKEQTVTKDIDLSAFSKPLHYELKVYGPNGKELTELSSKSDVDTSKMNISDVKMNFQVPEKYPEGVYLAKVKFYDDKGNEEYIEESVVEKDEMEITRFAFTDSIDAEFNFVERKDAIFKKGEKVGVYAQIGDIPQEFKSGKYHYNIAVDISVYDTEGKIISSVSKEDFFISEDSDDKPFELYHVRDELIPTTDSPSGQYNVNIAFRDLLTGKSVSKTSAFTLV